MQLTSQVGRDYFWNTASSVMAAASTVIMLLVVTRLLGEYAAGTFAFAFALGQQFQMLGAFEVRPLHATDVEHRFGFGSYHAARLVTTGLMIAGIVVFALASNGFTLDSLLIVLVGFLRVFDAFEDVFHGEFQRLGRLDVAGRAYFYRTLITTVLFTAALAATGDLLVTCVVTIAGSFVALIALNLPAARARYAIAPTFVASAVGSLLRTCLPLFFGAFLSVFLSSAPRFGIEHFLSREEQTYYAILFMPALVINLLGLAIFKPLLTTMAVHWNGHDRAAFLGVVRRGLLAVVAATAVTFGISWAIGLPLLGFIYGVDLSAFLTELLVLVAGGAFNAAGVVLYYALVTMRSQRHVFVGYVAAAAAVAAMVLLLIPRLGMLGACLAYGGAMALLAAVFAGFFVVGIGRSPASASAR
ncbi:MAG: hypothetical protein QM708_10380 [Propioniciclava sp.]|uniref:lipopolysaccharide biosynthesis protein n=1 Tax=Propioniciclava sp. TaxID=2038686 RepID=UPI0039E567B8